MPRPQPPAPVRDPETGCLLWQGTVQKNGYGRISVQGKQHTAHRYLYEQQVGPIPEGLDLDHLCRVRRCVEVSHLEPVTRSENLRRAWAHITHCPAGHPYDEENTYMQTRPSGHQTRCCRACRRVP